jgi:hypothetical protein
VGSYQLAITIGLLLAAIVNNSTHDRNDTGSYRIPIAVQFAWAIVLISGMLILPETPRYLIKSDRPEKAARALSRLRRLPADHPAIQDELAEIQANHEHELSLGKSTYLDCFRGGLLKRQLTGCGLQALQQLTGINFIFYVRFQRALFIPIRECSKRSSSCDINLFQNVFSRDIFQGQQTLNPPEEVIANSPLTDSTERNTSRIPASPMLSLSA